MEACFALAEGAVVCGATLVAALVDLRMRRIPNACPVAVVVAHIAAVIVRGAAGGSFACMLGEAFVGALVAFVPLLVCALLTDGVGGGDVKLLGALGFALGWQRVLAIMFLACAFTVCVGLVTHLVLRHAKMQSRLLATSVPMAPQIALSLAVTLCLFPM